MSAKEETQDPCDKDNREPSENGITANKPSEETLKETDTNKAERRVTLKEFPRSTTIDSGVIRSFFKADESSEEVESGHQSCCSCWKLPAVRTWIERIVLISICAAVAGAFTAPIIIYAIDADRGSDGEDSTIFIDLDLDNCQDESIQVCS